MTPPDTNKNKGAGRPWCLKIPILKATAPITIDINRMVCSNQCWAKNALDTAGNKAIMTGNAKQCTAQRLEIQIPHLSRKVDCVFASCICYIVTDIDGAMI